MSEMVERVARGIEPLIRSAMPIGNYELSDIARAAIAAMRGPTKEMVMAGDIAKDDCIDEDYSSDADGNRYNYTTIRSDISGRIFAAMIDAALK